MSTLSPQGFGNDREIGPSTRLECKICWYVYDPAEGDPDNDIAPGTSFEDLPDDWTCPDCGVGKEDFEVYED